VGYQTLRSVSDHHVFVVCRDGTFYELVPQRFGSRARGRACTAERSRSSSLSTAWRSLAMAALVMCELAVFKPEA
jgi:hypothetical protein